MVAANLYPALVAQIALLLYFALIFTLGMWRGKQNVDPTSGATGSPRFARACRAQINTTEQLVMFLPALWMCAARYSPTVATVLGVVWILGRILYVFCYMRGFEKRVVGFMLTMGATLALLICGLIGTFGLIAAVG